MPLEPRDQQVWLEMQDRISFVTDELDSDEMRFGQRSAMPDDSCQLAFAVGHGNGDAHREGVIHNHSRAIPGQILYVPKLPGRGSILIPRKHDKFGITDARL
jgi:hypothetical protein